MLLERLAPCHAVEKSPETVETDAALARAVAAYPRARFLHLVRHPVATQRSIAAHRERLQPGRGGEGQPMGGIAAWYVTHHRILDLAETLPTGRYLLQRAEDVLNDPGARLAAIAAWLGLATNEAAIAAMMRPWESRFAGPAPPGLGPLGGNDPAFLLADPRPRAVAVPEGLAPASGWTEGDRVWAEVADLARAMGY